MKNPKLNTNNHKQKNTEVIFTTSTSSSPHFHQSHQLGLEQNLLRVFSVSSIVAFVSAAVGDIALYLITTKDSFLLLLVLAILGIGIVSFSCWCSLPQIQSQSTFRLNLGSWLLTLTISVETLIGIYLLGTSQPMPLLFLVPITMSLFLLPWYGPLSQIAMAVGLTIGIKLLEWQGYRPALKLDYPASAFFSTLIWVLGLSLPTAMFLYISNRLKASYNLAVAQASNLSIVNQDITLKNNVAASISQQILSLASSLSSSAIQQAMGSQKQEQSIQEIITSIKELAQTAQFIAANTAQIQQASQVVKSATSRVYQASLKVTETGERGRQSVEQTLQSNFEISQLYSKLVATLTNLQEQSDQIKQIISSVAALSKEMHLLSLNAAIEAASAGEYGERFQVIASEIKHLADSSRKSSQDIGKILTKVEHGILAAGEAVQLGEAQAQKAEFTARQSALVVAQLASTIEKSAVEGSAIAQAVENMFELVIGITQATTQQYGATEQSLASMQAIGEVATQISQANTKISGTAGELKILSVNLQTSFQTLSASPLSLSDHTHGGDYDQNPEEEQFSRPVQSQASQLVRANY